MAYSTSGLARKVGKLARDPVLRRYLLLRSLGRVALPPPFTPHRPPYLKPVPPQGIGRFDSPEVARGAPGGPVLLTLAGTIHQADPARPDAIFDGPFADIEAEAALHRFAWIDLLPQGPETDWWVAALWRAWVRRFADAGHALAWEAYTAAERICNLLDFARRRGLPAADFAEILSAHGPRLLASLEYQGEHATHNHLANNGRGLYRLGAELGLEGYAEAGAEILEQEALRLFLPSGVLREGSTHYHLLYVRNYVDCWLAALRADRPEARRFEAIARRLFAVLPLLDLPGGFPLFGDISPDSAPEWLESLIPGSAPSGWLAAQHEIAQIMALRDSAPPGPPDRLAGDGWIRLLGPPWSGLIRAEPAGWPLYPGHGHQDFGHLELHWRDMRVLVDPGRRSYLDTDDMAGAAHNAPVLDGHSSYPENRPYYSPEFRRALTGPDPTVTVGLDSAELVHSGYSRLGFGQVVRKVFLRAERTVIEDKVAGSGKVHIARCFCTPLPVRQDGEGVILGEKFRMIAGRHAEIAPMPIWTAYGQSSPGTAITFAGRESLPWRDVVTVEAL